MPANQLLSSIGKASAVGVASLWLVSSSVAVAAQGTSTTLATKTSGAQVTATQTATPTKATTVKPSASLIQATARQAPDAKVTQLSLPTVRSDQVRVESINPAVRAPMVNASDIGTTVEVQQGQSFVLKTAPDGAQRIDRTPLPAKTKDPLQARLVVGVPDPVKGTVARQFQPFLSADVSPLTWNAGAASYVTTIVVGLDPLPGEDEDAVALPSAIRFQLSGENVTSIDPLEVDVAVAGTTGYRRFRVATGRFDQAIKVSAHSRFGDKSYEATVDPGPIQLEIGRADARVDGFGLGKTAISVRRLAANGQVWPALRPQQIPLQTTDGYLTPASVEIPIHGTTGETALVSRGWGQATVGERNAKSDTSKTTVVFAFPWLKFLLGFFGAAVAGALRVFTSEPGKRQGWGPVFVGCLASGVAIDILVALGAPLAPEWLLGMMRSELAWLAVGLIAGYPGVALVAWLGEKLFSFKKAEPASASASG